MDKAMISILERMRTLFYVLDPTEAQTTLINAIVDEAIAAWNTRATPEPVAPTPSQEPDRSRMYKVGDQWWPYPHGMTEEEWNRKIGTPSYEHAKDLPED